MPSLNLNFKQFTVDVDRFRIGLHEFCNFIPIVSTLTNAIAVIQKQSYSIKSDCNSGAYSINGHYYKHLKEQDFEEDWILLIPVANTIFSIYRWIESISNVTTVVNEIALANIKNANKYYYHPSNQRFFISSSEIDDRDALISLIRNNDIDSLKTSPLIEKYGVNYPFGRKGNTLLHIAYAANRPDIVSWLLELGASEGVSNAYGFSPIEYASLDYKDSQTRVVNELAKQYFEQCGSSVKDPHVLYELILKFIHEKKWRYCDSFEKDQGPFRDEDQVVFFGSPSLIYHVNCVSLSKLFLYVAKEVGIDAKRVMYFPYISISPQEKEKREIMGDFKMFDGSGESGDPFRYDMHSVVFSEGHHFDLTMMCKYKDSQEVLARQSKMIYTPN